VTDYVRVMYDARRGQRQRVLLEIAGSVAALGPGAAADDPVSQEAWQLVAASVGDAHTSREHLVAWKATSFDLLARDALNRGAWVGDLVLLPGQRATLDHESGDVLALVGDVEAVAPQRRALESLGALRDALATHPNVVLVRAEDVADLPKRTLEALGVSEAELASTSVGDPFAARQPLAVGLPYVLVEVDTDTVVLAEHVEPWHAIAEAQGRGASFGDAIATGVLMMSADSGYAAIPPAAIAPDGVGETIERDRQEARLAHKLERWIGLVAATRGRRR